MAALLEFATQGMSAWPLRDLEVSEAIRWSLKDSLTEL